MSADLKLWLPINRKEMELRGWDEVDVVLISGDAYVDHPSFGAAVIGRVLEHEGCRVAILPQPNWRDDLRDFKKFGKPRYFFGITSGAMDSMVNHYTALKRLRSTDAYTAGNQAGFRPDYAVNVYSRIVRQLFPDSWIVIGGVEASMRRLTHYDYWSDSLMPPILESSGADLLVYGMGEKPMRDITDVFRQKTNPDLSDFKHIPQIAYMDSRQHVGKDVLILPSHEECLKSKRQFAEAFRLTEAASVQFAPPTLCQNVGERTVVVNPPARPMETAELDAVYELPFTRLPHPHYDKRGEIPAFNMIQNSINIHRGCFGGCSFCTISLHQGKRIVSRSKESILKEAERLSRMPYFKGHITDLGGPSANMYQAHGKESTVCSKCRRISCIYPKICPNLHFDHRPMTELYREVNAM
ncbi:MAG: YgiQ family radical SAM protein, partial [Bacteroidales bacterium]|nr:YgiQ family radical SAM protein [Bacteroidales bacterium]